MDSNNWEDKKILEVRLFFNISQRTFYIAIGNCLCPIKDKLVTAIQEREHLHIVHAENTLEIQKICNEK